MLIPLARAAGSQRNTCLPYEIYGLGILRSIGLVILGSIGFGVMRFISFDVMGSARVGILSLAL